MDNRAVLISGAGVAGPALAYWLGRYGLRPTIVERAPELRHGGYKVDVRGAATEVLRRMGLLPRTREAATDMREVSFVDDDGRSMATMSADLLMGRHGDDLEIMRTDLTRILHDATRHDVEYVFGDAVTSLTTDAGGVRVEFERAPARRFDLVVGADGVHSATRALTFGGDPVVHLDAYLCVFTVPNDDRLDRRELFHSAPGRFVNIYATGRTDEAKALLAFRSPRLSFDRRDVVAQRRLVADRFDGLRWQVPRLLRALHDATDFYFDSISQVHLPYWSADRTVLVGDAAYCPSPASGQGTSLALVGAYVLAGELAVAAGDHRAAVRRYEAVMRPYVGLNLACGRTMARDMMPDTRWQLTLRNVGMRTMRYNPFAARIVERPLRPLRHAADGIDLPPYPALRGAV